MIFAATKLSNQLTNIFVSRCLARYIRLQVKSLIEGSLLTEPHNKHCRFIEVLLAFVDVFRPMMSALQRSAKSWRWPLATRLLWKA